MPPTPPPGAHSEIKRQICLEGFIYKNIRKEASTKHSIACPPPPPLLTVLCLRRVCASVHKDIWNFDFNFGCSTATSLWVWAPVGCCFEGRCSLLRRRSPDLFRQSFSFQSQYIYRCLAVRVVVFEATAVDIFMARLMAEFDANGLQSHLNWIHVP